MILVTLIDLAYSIMEKIHKKLAENEQTRYSSQTMDTDLLWLDATHPLKESLHPFQPRNAHMHTKSSIEKKKIPRSDRVFEERVQSLEALKSMGKTIRIPSNSPKKVKLNGTPLYFPSKPIPFPVETVSTCLNELSLAEPSPEPKPTPIPQVASKTTISSLNKQYKKSNLKKKKKKTIKPSASEPTLSCKMDSVKLSTLPTAKSNLAKPLHSKSEQIIKSWNGNSEKSHNEASLDGQDKERGISPSIDNQPIKIPQDKEKSLVKPETDAKPTLSSTFKLLEESISQEIAFLQDPLKRNLPILPQRDESMKTLSPNPKPDESIKMIPPKRDESMDKVLQVVESSLESFHRLLDTWDAMKAKKKPIVQA